MVNRRMCDSVVGILYRLMTLYAPGGESEKTLTLNKLQNPTRCTDAQSAAEELRAWERWKNRAQTLGLLTPDPTILVKAVAGSLQGYSIKGRIVRWLFGCLWSVRCSRWIPNPPWIL